MATAQPSSSRPASSLLGALPLRFDCPDTPELAQITGYNPAFVARCISVDRFGRMLTYGAIVAAGWGFWRYDVIKRERAARIAAENRLIAIQQQAAEERQQAAAERLLLIGIINDLAAQQRNR